MSRPYVPRRPVMVRPDADTYSRWVALAGEQGMSVSSWVLWMMAQAVDVDVVFEGLPPGEYEWGWREDGELVVRRLG